MFAPCVAILIIRSGRASNHFVAVNHFPVTIGRSANSQLRLEDPGIWDMHAKLTLLPGKGILLQPLSDGTVTLHDQPVTTATVLRNGDIFHLSTIQCQFQLGPSAPGKLMWREWLFWLLLGAAIIGQIYLIGSLW